MCLSHIISLQGRLQLALEISRSASGSLWQFGAAFWIFLADFMHGPVSSSFMMFHGLKSKGFASFCFIQVVQAVPSKPTVADLSWRILACKSLTKAWRISYHRLWKLMKWYDRIPQFKCCSAAVLLNLRSGKLRAGSEDLLHVPQRHSGYQIYQQHAAAFSSIQQLQSIDVDCTRMYQDSCVKVTPRWCSDVRLWSSEVHLGHRFV